VEQVLRRLHEGTSAVTGEAYLSALVRTVAGALGVGWCFIGTLLPGPPRRIRTLAVWRGDRPADDLEYALSGTPCEQVVAGQACQFTSGVTALFPTDPLLLELRIESYLGVPIPGPDGRARGVLAALDERPMPPRPELGALLGIFAARAGAELDRLAAERRLAESEARFRLIVTNCSEGVCLLGEEQVARYANPQLAAILGVSSPEALVGRSYRDFTGPEERAELERRVEQRRRGQADRYETRLRTADGRSILVEVSAAPLADEEGRISGTIAMLRDVTERRALDEQVREAQKLESLGVLAGGLAHEFNNLLVGMLANSSYVAAELPAGSELRAAVEDVHASASKATELTRQLLAYSGRGKFTVGPVRLNRIASEVLVLAAPSLGRRTIVTQDLAADLPEVEGDAGQLGQVVMNLLTNAADAIRLRGGTIGIRTAVAALDAAALARFHGGETLAPGRHVVLEVQDDGPGMDGATRDRVFEPFFSTKFAGRGLGLPAAMGIVKGHRGGIRLESEPGQGSRVTIVLPLLAGAPPARRPAAPAPRPAPPPASGAGRTVLVADDEEVVRRASRRALERAGYQVLEACDGREAVACFRSEAGRIACILLDLTMPGMGGEEALSAIRQLDAEVPVVLTSGYSSRDEASEEAAGARVAFLPKPFVTADLLGAVGAAIGLAQP
jgi:PAS domain S-box-containing protein